MYFEEEEEEEEEWEKHRWPNKLFLFDNDEVNKLKSNWAAVNYVWDYQRHTQYSISTLRRIQTSNETVEKIRIFCLWKKEFSHDFISSILHKNVCRKSHKIWFIVLKITSDNVQWQNFYCCLASIVVFDLNALLLNFFIRMKCCLLLIHLIDIFLSKLRKYTIVGQF